MKPRSAAQAALFGKKGSKPKPPTALRPAPDPPPLSPEQRAQEVLEDRRFESGWRERREPPRGSQGG